MRDKQHIKCDNNCVECKRYSSFAHVGGEYDEYDCIIAQKTVRFYPDGSVKEI